jgi:hypothetical protein
MNDEELRKALRASAWRDTELARDLWPKMLTRFDQRRAGIFWLDWVLMTLLAIWCVLFPAMIPGLVYHL